MWAVTALLYFPVQTVVIIMNLQLCNPRSLLMLGRVSSQAYKKLHPILKLTRYTGYRASNLAGCKV